MNEQQMQFSYDRRRTSTLTLDEQPGAHTGATRKYIHGYSDSNIVFLNTSTGNDANTGASIAQALLTYSAAATAAGSTKKIRLVNSATLTANITKPTEATIGTTSSIASSSLTAPFSTWSSVLGSVNSEKIVWSPRKSRFVSVGGSGHIRISTDGQTWTSASSPGYGSTNISDVIYLESTKTFYSVGYAGKVGTSTDGDSWSVSSPSPFGGADLFGISYSETLGRWVCVGSSNGSDTTVNIWYSDDFVNWSKSVTPFIYSQMRSVDYAFGKFVAVSASSTGIAYSIDGVSWTAATTGANADTAWVKVYYSSLTDKLIAFGTSATDNGRTIISSDGITWALVGTSGLTSTNYMQGVVDCIELGYVVAVGTANKVYYSADANVWTLATSSGNTKAIAYSPLYETFGIGGNGSIHASTAYATTISASVAGFSIQAVQYSGTITAYNCTLKQPGTTAALSLDSCRVTESGSHISNNAVTSLATLYRGDRHLTCTPASQNAIDLNLDTWGGTFYIYNASQTGYERIRDCIGNGPIVANYNVTVGGQANVEGTSVNVLFDAEVTHNDPRFVDETDYKLEFQTNGYVRNSFAAGRSNIYFNSAGNARDIGAWSYVESAVSHYYAKTEVIYKGEISHGLEFALNEQQGDSGVVSVYGNTRRVKEVITITYGTTYQREKAIFEYMLTLQDKGVKIQLDAEWSDNAGTVVVNGNQSAGVEFLTVDSTVYYEGMWLTVAGKQYWVMRASPSPSVATKLILDRPLEDAVLDNDVIVRNYPAGAGEYQFSGPMNLTVKRVHPTALQGYYSGFQIRLVRKKQ